VANAARVLWLSLGQLRRRRGCVRDAAAFLLWGGARLPERGLERGLSPPDEPYSYVSRAFGKRIGGARGHRRIQHLASAAPDSGQRELLVLIPRCLSKQALDAAGHRGRYEVPVFVATRGSSRGASSASAGPARSSRWRVNGNDDRAARRGRPAAVLGSPCAPNGPCRDADARPRRHGGVGEGLGGA